MIIRRRIYLQGVISRTWEARNASPQLEVDFVVIEIALFTDKSCSLTFAGFERMALRCDSEPKQGGAEAQF